MRQLFLIVHDVRSAHNVGSLLRTADAMGVKMVYLSGYTPYPADTDDERLPHIRDKIDRRIHKTALGAETTTQWEYEADVLKLIRELKRRGIEILALEQTPEAKELKIYQPVSKLALIVGSEVGGLGPEVLEAVDEHVMIPMLGKKESLNVASASAIALYHLRHIA